MRRIEFDLIKPEPDGVYDERQILRFNGNWEVKEIEFQENLIVISVIQKVKREEEFD